MRVITVERVTMSLPRDLLAQVDAISEAEDRPRSSTVRRLLRQALGDGAQRVKLVGESREAVST